MKLKNHLKSVTFDSEKKVDYIGYFVLALGLLLCIMAAYHVLQTSKQLADTRTVIDNKQRLSVSAQAVDLNNIDPKAKAVAEKIKKQLHYPWSALFFALEAIHTKQVSLMSIRPDFEKKEVVITAEAENAHQMLEYIRVFEQQKSVDHVELLSQETVKGNQQGRVNFVMMVELI